MATPIGKGLRSFFEEGVNPTFREAALHLARQTDLLEKIADRELIETMAQEFTWLRGTSTCDATGQVQIPLENRVGNDLELVSYSAVAGASSNGAVLFYHNSVEPQNLIWVNPQTQYSSEKFHNGMIVPVNGVVVAQFQAVGNGQLVYVNVFVRKVEQRKAPSKAVVSQVGW